MLKKVLLMFAASFLLITGITFASGIEVEDNYDLQTALNYAANSNIDTVYLVTSGGLYTTTDTNFYFIHKPLVIKAKDGLAEMPVITHSDPNMGVIELFRVNSDFTLDGVILDGGNEATHGIKYAVRVSNWEDYPNGTDGFDVRLKNCIFRDFYQDKDPEGAGHGLYFAKDINAGTVVVENCKFMNFGDECIRMTETEKYSTERCLDTLIVRNTSFTNIDAECIRFYGDTDTSTTDAYVLFENLSVNRSGTRMIYVKNNQYSMVRNLLVTNSRMPGADRQERADYVLQTQGTGSYVTNVDTMNMVWGNNASDTRVSSTKGGEVNEAAIFGFDPDYADEANFDLTLNAGSHAYFSGENNAHLGDLNFATNTPTVSPLNVTVVGNGNVTFSPERLGLTFTTGTTVTMTAVPEEGYEFVSWSGDVTGTDLSADVTVDGIKNVVATFSSDPTGVDDEDLAVNTYNLGQNYPNPFNPSTLITFSLADAGYTTITVYDVLGEEVAKVLSGDLASGSHSVVFDGSNISSGIYFYQIQSGSFTATKKMMLIK